MDDRDVLHQADALMQRWRTQRPSQAEPPAEAEDTAAPFSTDHDVPLPEPEEDIPVLTEAVADAALLPPLNAPHDPYALQRQALREELDQWLDHALPNTILRVLDGLADQLIGQLGQQARDDLLPRLEAALRARGDTAQAADPDQAG